MSLGCDYLSMSGLKLNHVSKMGPWPLSRLQFRYIELFVKSISCSAITHFTGRFLPMDISLDYWIVLVAMERRYIYQLRYSIGVVSGFATDCPCGVWSRDLPQLCWSTFWRYSFKRQLVWKVENDFCKFCFRLLLCTHRIWWCLLIYNNLIFL